MLAKFEQHINSHFPFIKGKKILIAVSAGIDSVVLAHLFCNLKVDSAFAHCNFRLRGKESDDDEQFVKDLGKQLNVRVFTTVFDTKTFAKRQKLSIQMAARQLRYEWFETIRKEKQLDLITTAHQLDDNLETFLINFTRGTGLNGLKGIPEITDTIIRPLLAFSREEITAYALENNILWREDATNAKTAYQRNKIRHQIVPVLKEMNPNLLTSFKKTTEHLKGSQDIISDTIKSVKKTLISPTMVENNEIHQQPIQKINIHGLKQLGNPKAYLFELLNEYGFKEWNDVVALLDAQSGKQVLSETHQLVNDRDHLLLKPIESQLERDSFLIAQGQETLITEKISIRLAETTSANLNDQSKNVILVDLEKLQFPLTLRKRNEGDYFYPLGMTGKKKISKFFKDEKLSLFDKENIWLLCSNNDVVWVVNKRLDNRYKVTDKTIKTMLVTYNEPK